MCTPSNTRFLGSLDSASQTESRSTQPFPHISRQWVTILYSGPPFSPSKLYLCSLHGGMGDLDWTPSNTWFLGPTHFHIPNGILIGSAVFAGLTIVTETPMDWQTDRQTDRRTDKPHYSICNNKQHLCSTVMHPNEYKWFCVKTGAMLVFSDISAMSSELTMWHKKLDHWPPLVKKCDE